MGKKQRITVHVVGDFTEEQMIDLWISRIEWWVLTHPPFCF